MSRNSLSLKPLKTIDDVYKSREYELIFLVDVARLNKLDLAFLRRVDVEPYRYWCPFKKARVCVV